MDKNVFPVPDFVAGNLVPQCRCPDAPAGDGFEAFPAAVTLPLQVHPSAKGRSRVAIRKDGSAALWALELEERGMREGRLDERAQPHGIRGELRSDAANAVGHLHIEGDEEETVTVFPVVIATVDEVSVLIERLGEETLLLGRAHCVLLEETVFVHDTDFF